MDQETEWLDPFTSYSMPYVYVFWKQAYPAPFETAALHRFDPQLRALGLADAAARLRNEEVWRIGPLNNRDEADSVVVALQFEGLTVELHWQ
jgi:hypothetical protein